MAIHTVKRTLSKLSNAISRHQTRQTHQEIMHLKEHLDILEQEMRQLQQLANQRLFLNRIQHLESIIFRLETENYQLRMEICRLKITRKTTHRKAATSASATESATSRYRKNTGGWRRKDIKALRKFQNLSITELSVMFTNHSSAEIQSMLSKIKDREI